MSSTDSPKPLLIRVKRKTNEEKSLPNKRCKFIGTTDSPKDEDIYRLVSQMSANKSVPERDDKQKIEIKDFEEWNPKKNIKPKEMITCNGQPLESVENRLEDSLDYIYDIYVVEGNEWLDIEDPIHYRECEDSEEDSNDENYAHNDYPDDNEVSEDVIDYYSYSEDHNISQNDLEDNFDRHRISSDYELSDEEIDAIDKYYLKNKRLALNNEEEEESEESSEEY